MKTLLSTLILALLLTSKAYAQDCGVLDTSNVINGKFGYKVTVRSGAQIDTACLGFYPSAGYKENSDDTTAGTLDVYISGLTTPNNSLVTGDNHSFQNEKYELAVTSFNWPLQTTVPPRQPNIFTLNVDAPAGLVYNMTIEMIGSTWERYCTVQEYNSGNCRVYAHTTLLHDGVLLNLKDQQNIRTSGSRSWQFVNKLWTVF